MSAEGGLPRERYGAAKSPQFGRADSTLGIAHPSDWHFILARINGLCVPEDEYNRAIETINRLITGDLIIVHAMFGDAAVGARASSDLHDEAASLRTQLTRSEEELKRTIEELEWAMNHDEADLLREQLAHSEERVKELQNDAAKSESVMRRMAVKYWSTDKGKLAIERGEEIDRLRDELTAAYARITRSEDSAKEQLARSEEKLSEAEAVLNSIASLSTTEAEAAVDMARDYLRPTP